MRLDSGATAAASASAADVHQFFQRFGLTTELVQCMDNLVGADGGDHLQQPLFGIQRDLCQRIQWLQEACDCLGIGRIGREMELHCDLISIVNRNRFRAGMIGRTAIRDLDQGHVETISDGCGGGCDFGCR